MLSIDWNRPIEYPQLVKIAKSVGPTADNGAAEINLMQTDGYGVRLFQSAIAS
jgi:hypothetical protein